MFGGKNRHEVVPGDYSHDAGQVAKLGKLGCVAFGVVGVVGELGDFVTDVTGSEGIADDLLAAGGWCVAAVASYTVFRGLQNYYEKITEQIRSEHVTE